MDEQRPHPPLVIVWIIGSCFIPALLIVGPSLIGDWPLLIGDQDAEKIKCHPRDVFVGMSKDSFIEKCGVPAADIESGILPNIHEHLVYRSLMSNIFFTTAYIENDKVTKVEGWWEP